MNNNQNWIPLLKRVFIFSAFTDSQLHTIAKKMTHFAFPKGAILYHQDTRGDCLYLILSGTVRLNQKPLNSKKEGRDATVAFLNRGDVLGQMALLANDIHHHTAVIDSPCELVVLNKKDFDYLLKKNPTMGVPLSRLLSNRLSKIRMQEYDETPGRLISLVPALPTRDQVIFSVNLGLSMVHQSKNKVLLFAVNQHPELWARGLGLDAQPATSEQVESGCFEDAKKFNALISIHPSGLELITVEESAFFDSLGKFQFPLLQHFKESYDATILVLPPLPGGILLPLLEESDDRGFVLGSHSYPMDIETLSNLTNRLPPEKKVKKIWCLNGNPFIPKGFTPDIKVPWDKNWSRTFAEKGTAYIPDDAPGSHRMMDSLARWFSQSVIGFAMGSGAAYGYALIGMLRVFEREGIFPDIVSGTSMGALIGAFYAAGLSVEEIAEIARSMTRGRLRSMIDLTIPRSGLISGRSVLTFLKSHLGDKNFSDLNLPFSCAATNIMTGKEVVLRDGNVAEAVRASISLPFFFKPHKMNDQYLVDGGLVNPVPTSHLIDMGATILLSANLTSPTREKKIPRLIGWKKRLPSLLRGPAIPEIMLRTIYTMQYEISQARSGLAHVSMSIQAPELLWWDLDKADNVIRLGEISAEENLTKIKSLIPFFKDACKTHLKPRGKKIY